MQQITHKETMKKEPNGAINKYNTIHKTAKIIE